MALIQMMVMSESLMRTVPVNVILPADKRRAPGEPAREEKPFRTLYLLHGVTGSSFDWICGTRIKRLAENNDLAVVMPSGENRFYVDQEKGHHYFGEFIGRELVDLTRRMFPLSRRREDTFIAGLSMGGYGAVRNGLKYHGNFSHVAGLSPALITDGIDRLTDGDINYPESRSYAESVFGDLSKVEGSDKDPKWLAKRLAEEAGGAPDGREKLPKFYLACGLSDGLLSRTRDMRDFLEALGYDVTYAETPGAHDWDFWGSQIEKVIDWLPPAKAARA